MDIKRDATTLFFYTDPEAIHPNDSSGCAIRQDGNGSLTVQVNWDRPSVIYPILTVDYRTNDRDHKMFNINMRNALKHTMHAHITSVQNLLMAFMCGVARVDDEYPIAKHEFRHNGICCVKKSVLESHWETTMTQYRGLSSRIIEEIGRSLGMQRHCIVILSSDAEDEVYDITDNTEVTIAAQLVYQRQLKLSGEVRKLGNGKLSSTRPQ